MSLCGFVCRYLISQHPDVEAKLAAELKEAGLLVTPQRPVARAMEYADLARLTYLGWVCKVGALEVFMPQVQNLLPRQKTNAQGHCMRSTCAGVMHRHTEALQWQW